VWRPPSWSLTDGTPALMHSDRATHSRYNHPLVTAHQQAAEDVENLVFEGGERR
jgi:hypothetical protein